LKNKLVEDTIKPGAKPQPRLRHFFWSIITVWTRNKNHRKWYFQTKFYCKLQQKKFISMYANIFLRRGHWAAL